MNNFNFETKTRYILLYIFQGTVRTKHTNKSKKLIFYFIKKDSITLDTSDLSFRRYNQVCERSHQQKVENI